MLVWIEHIVCALVAVILVNVWLRDGLHGIITLFVAVLKYTPGYQTLVDEVLDREVKKFVREIKHPPHQPTVTTAETTHSNVASIVLPKSGVPHVKLLDEMRRLKSSEKSAEESRLFAYVYTGNNDHFNVQKEVYDIFTEKTGLSPEHDELMKTFHQAFLHENALSPMLFPSLRRFETEVVSMTASMFHGDGRVVGCLTSGGTESILMALKTYRDRARALHPNIKHPEMVAPITIHPAHEKAAHYFGLIIVHVSVDSDGNVDIMEYAKAITPNTIALLSSAPHYCHGVVDPIPEISALAIRHGLPLHVDACFGGFMLPWVEKLGYPVPTFDFRLAGVTSISADIHKYGFGCKGASVLLYKDDSIRRYQIFAYSGWPGGLFGSPSMAGSRPGGNIAAAWAALMAMGEDGYLSVAKQLMDITDRLKQGISAIQGLRIVGKPHMTAFAVASMDPDVDVLALADVMEEKGWILERQQRPHSLHFSIMPHHVTAVDQLLDDLKTSVNTVKANKSLSKQGSAAMYGMIAHIPDTDIVDDFIVKFFSEIYKI